MQRYQKFGWVETSPDHQHQSNATRPMKRQRSGCEFEPKSVIGYQAKTRVICGHAGFAFFCGAINGRPVVTTDSTQLRRMNSTTISARVKSDANQRTQSSLIRHKSCSAYRCNCGERFDCIECQQSRKNKGVRASAEYLLGSPQPRTMWFGSFTQDTTGTVPNDVENLKSTLGKLQCRMRNERAGRGMRLGLDKLHRGVFAMHYLNKRGEWQIHWHGVFAASPEFEHSALQDGWVLSGGGFADVEPLRSMYGALHYAIGGDIPVAAADRQMLAQLFQRARLIRRIGR